MAELTITLPEGYPIPENVVSGDTFEALVELKLNDDGTATAQSLDGMALAAEAAVAETDAELEAGIEDGGFIDAVDAQM